MNLKPIIDEMRAYWIGGESGGQLWMGGAEAHYNADQTPIHLIWMLQASVCRKRILPIYHWEIQAEEKDTRAWN